MSIPTSLSELSEPTDLFTVQSEVLGNPKDGVGVSSVLCGTELAVQTTCEATESKATLSPGIGPAKRLVVVDAFARERSLVIILVDFTLRAAASALSERTFN